ncbi:spore germination protein [Fictibacillus fluitans]|uniref:Spore germination protein n=1 Tax=Fictibacillus fluitans TaxID=3058422 RepID=A0ABT8HSI0_9BACL|nr:spore germination protein [Fictibacillus sp. NE201]MDN4523732.1 spore germination protein [Fictibacillus sp. NE201]
MKSRKKWSQHLYKTPQDRPISATSSLSDNVDYLQRSCFYTDDLITRNLPYNNNKAMILYLVSLSDVEKIQKAIVEPLLLLKNCSVEEAVPVNFKKTNNLVEAEFALNAGQCLLVSEGSETIYIIDTYIPVKRAIEEPGNEQVIRGSHEGFVEHMQTNLHMIRKRINHPNFTVRQFIVGRLTNTKISVLYINKLAKDELIEEIERRIRSISSDSIQTPGFIEEFIEDTPFSPFPQVLNTERPDRVAANLLDGKAAILMEGSPTVLIAPATFFSLYQSPDDYNTRSLVGSFFRLIRLASFIIAILVPAFYISLISFHYEVIPIDMIFSVKSGLTNVPFPPLIEAAFMQITLELLKEAGIRLPRPIAPTIGIVGGLVIGNAVVQANLVSNIMIVVVAITAISSFVVPSNEMSTVLRILGFPFMIAAATFGFIGIVFALMLLLMHLCKLESFGSPYFAPFAPINWKDIKDTIIRVPRWKMNTRPKDAHPSIEKNEYYSREWKNNDKQK